MPLVLRPFVLFALAVAPAITQETVGDGPRLKRESGFGRVLDASGKPWVGANVFLEHRAHADVGEGACVDRLEATTDTRGQFKVKLLPGARYTVWARGAVEGGTFRQTDVATDATGHSPILLAEREPGFVRRVTLHAPEGDTSWAGREPTIWIGEDFGSLDRYQVVEPEDGVFTLPASPDSSLSVGVWLGGFCTMRLWVATTVTKEREGVPAGPDEDADREATARAMRGVTKLALKPLHRREITFRGPDRKPTANAVWWPDSRAPSPRTWRTGKDGVVEAFVASDKDQPRLYGSYVFWAPACAEWSVEPGSWTTGSPPVTERVLRAGVDVRGRLLLDGKPLADMPVVLQSSIRTSESSTWFGVDGRVLRTDARGGLHVPGRTSEFPYRLVAALPPAVRARLSGDGYPAASVAILQVESDDEPDDLGDVRLERLKTVDLRIRSVDGTPPGSITVLLKGVGGRMRGRSEWPHEPTRIYTDRRGKVRILSAETEGLFLLAGGPTGSVLHRFDGTETELDLKLDARTAVPVRVVFPDGSPAAGARVSLRRGDVGDLSKDMRDALGDLWSVHAFPWARGTTDADGRALLVAPIRAKGYPVSVYGDGVKSARPTLDVEDLEPGEVVEIVVERG